MTAIDEAAAARLRAARLAVQLGGAAGHAPAGDRARRPRRWRARARPRRAGAALAHRRARASASWPRARRAAGAAGKVARDVTLLAQTEVAEVREAGGAAARRRCRTSATRWPRSPCWRARAQAPGLVATLLAAHGAGARARGRRLAGRVAAAVGAAGADRLGGRVVPRACSRRLEVDAASACARTSTRPRRPRARPPRAGRTARSRAHRGRHRRPRDRRTTIVGRPADAPLVLVGNSLGTKLRDVGRAAPRSPSLRAGPLRPARARRLAAPPGPYAIADLGARRARAARPPRCRARAPGRPVARRHGRRCGWRTTRPSASTHRRSCARPRTSARREHWHRAGARPSAREGRRGDRRPVVERWTDPGRSAAHPERPALAARHARRDAADGYAACCAAIERMDLRAELPRDRRADARDRRRRGPLDAARARRGDRRRDPRRAPRDPRRRRAPRQRRAPGRGRPPDPGAPAHDDDRYEARDARPPRGARRRRTWTARSRTRPTFTRPFQEFITRGAWGDVWTRDGLDRRTRSVITLVGADRAARENETACTSRRAAQRPDARGDPRGAPPHGRLRGRARGQQRVGDRAETAR